MRSKAKNGYINESMILLAVDNHYYKDLSSKWKRHVKRMFKEIKDNDLIKARYYEHKDAKPDLVITVNGRRVMLSIKSGHSPTVHYETLITFYKFLRDLGVSERIIRIIDFYHYGYSRKKGVPAHIYTREELIANYSEYIKEANDYFSKNEDMIREIILRVVLKGRFNDRDPLDYFYYGSSSKGYLLSSIDILKLILKNKNDTCQSICFNALTYTSCARNKDNPRKDHLQIHWPILCKWFYDEEFMKKYG